MKIIRSEIYKSAIKLKEPFVISLGKLESAENIFIRIKTDTGLTGYGECSPFMTINGESIDTCFIVAQYLGKVLIGKDPVNVEHCSLTMDAVIYGNSSIKSAFDMALHDIAAQAAGLPLYAFLNGSAGKKLVTDYTVSIGDAPAMAEAATEIVEQGFRVIKVKLGDSGEKDVERVRRIREAVGEEIPLRLDANQGWQPEEAIQTLTALAPYNIQYCEEPIPRWAFMELPRIRANSPIPVMADESCSDHHDAERLINLKACDLFNVKLGKSSGIHKARKIIQLAEQAGINMQVGGFLESRLGFTASAHLALCSDNIIYYDFDTPLMFTEDPVIGGIAYGHGGQINIPDTPGLGAMVDEDYLKKLTGIVIE